MGPILHTPALPVDRWGDDINRKPDPTLTFRPAQPEDAAAIFALFDAVALNAVGFLHRETERPPILWARYADAIPGLSTRVALSDGVMIGAALLPPPQGRTLALAAVHPDWLGRGAGGALADWLVDQASGTCQTDPAADLTLVQRILASDQRAHALLEAHGWRHVRSMLRMERDLTPADLALPAASAVEVRPVVPEREMDALSLAHYLGFRGSEDYDPAHFAITSARWKQWVASDSRHNPAAWFVATAPDGDGTIAGVCLCTLDTVERDDMAWISRVAVRAPWRRQGLGRALLAYAFAELTRRGKRRVGLYVVAENAAAVALYRNMGMSEVPELQFSEFEFALCPSAAWTGGGI